MILQETNPAIRVCPIRNWIRPQDINKYAYYRDLNQI